MAENQQAAAGSDNQNQPQFALQRIYVKDLSFESPNSPLVFQEQWKPQVNLDLNTSHNKVSDNQYEVVLSLTVTAKVGEKVAYIVEIQQGGVFLVLMLAPVNFDAIYAQALKRKQEEAAGEASEEQQTH